MYDIISIGDAVLDTFIEVEDAFVTRVTSRKGAQLCLNYGDKIPVKRMHQKVAGNALNNAVGSARLGMKAAFYSIVGDDDVGEQIARKMKKEGISTKYLKIQKKASTNYSVVIDFEHDRTILQYSYPREYRLPADLSPTRWFYYTALGKNHGRLEKELVSRVSSSQAKLAFNPGGSQLKEGVKKMRDVLRHTEVIFVNREEAELLVGDSTDIPGLLYRLHELGPHIAVITDGKNGAYASNSISVYYLPIFPGKFVEATGAGDAFATGFVAGLFHGKNVPEAMRWGTANAAGAVSKIGPQDGLLTLSEIEKTIQRFGRIKPRLISNGRGRV